MPSVECHFRTVNIMRNWIWIVRFDFWLIKFQVAVASLWLHRLESFLHLLIQTGFHFNLMGHSLFTFNIFKGNAVFILCWCTTTQNKRKSGRQTSAIWLLSDENNLEMGNRFKVRSNRGYDNDKGGRLKFIYCNALGNGNLFLIHNGFAVRSTFSSHPWGSMAWHFMEWKSNRSFYGLSFLVQCLPCHMRFTLLIHFFALAASDLVCR